MKKTGIRDYLFLHIVLIIYSLTSVLSKSAADKTGIALVVLYGAVLFCLMLYAVLWQGVLKKFPLTTAFANKAIVVVWGILWGWLFFEEAVTWNKLVGAVVIIAGILIVVREKDE